MTASASPRSLSEILSMDVTGRVEDLQKAYLGQQAGAQAWAQGALAVLRGADPADPTKHPEAWPVLLADTPDELEPKGREDAPTDAEIARHCAIVLYAQHQQSEYTLPMHVRGIAFGQAVRALSDARRTGDEEFNSSVRARLDQVLLASTWSGRVEHLRTLVRLMRADRIGFDYGRFAANLWRLATPGLAAHARLAIGRSFYRRPTRPSDDTSIETLTTGEAS